MTTPRAAAWHRHLFRLVLLVLPALAASGHARADELDGLFTSGRASLEGGHPAEAIADFEALADRGLVDANVSFDRGLAYAERVRLGGEQTGDLGRAAHGFEEARSLTHDRAVATEAARALEVVRAEVARRRARSGASVELEQSSSLGESILHLIPEDAWALAALVASVLTGAGLLVRRRATRPRVRVAATTAVAVALPLLVAFSAATRVAQSERASRVDGVIVSPSARPSDARGIALLHRDPLPEGARVRIVSREGAEWTEIRWGSLAAWIPAAAVRPLARVP